MLAPGRMIRLSNVAEIDHHCVLTEPVTQEGVKQSMKLRI